MSPTAGIERALLVFKPDGLLRFGQAARLLVRALAQRGFNFRLLSPTISNVTPELAGALYPEAGPTFDIHRRYMAAGNNDPRIVSAPVIALIAEAEQRGEPSLIPILRSPGVIGPTNLERSLLTADQATAEEIRQSLRYQLTLGSGGRIWPFPKIVGDPMYNRIHCSASATEAAREIEVMFGPAATRDLTRLPLIELYNQAEAARLLLTKFATLGYRDFGEAECLQLAYEVNGVMPLLLELEGLYFENLHRPAVTVFDLGRTAGPPAPLALIIGLCGDSGSGKSSLVAALKALGYRELILHTNRPSRETEIGGTNYHFTTDAAMLDMLAQGEFIGVDRINNNLYGLSQAALHPGRLQDSRWVLAAGPNTLAGLRNSLPDSVKLGTIFIESSPDTLAQRLVSRNDTQPDDLQARLARLPGTQERYGSRLAEFDAIIKNDLGTDLADVTQQIRDFAARLAAGEIAPRRESAPAYRMTPQRRLVQYLLDKSILPEIKQLRAGVPDGNVDQLEANVKVKMEQPLTLFITELFKLEKSKAYVTAADVKEIEIIVNHLLNMLVANLQTWQPAELVKALPRRFGRLWHYGSAAMAEMLFKLIQDLRQEIPAEEIDFYIAAHDLGKVISYFNHPELSYQLLQQYNLPEFLDQFTPEQKTLASLVVRYHQNLADCAYSFISWESGVVELFANPEVRQFLANPDDSVNLPRLKQFLTRLKYMSLIDTAGSRSANGGLRKLNTGLYLEIADDVYRLIKSQAQDYSAALVALKEAGKSAGRQYLPVIPFCWDPQADTHADGLGFYWQLIADSVTAAIAQGKFTETDWQNFLTDFAKIDSKYSPMLWWAYFTEQPTDPTLHPGNVTPTSLWHFFVLVDKIARTAAPAFPESQKLQMWFYDSQGQEVAGLEREKASAWAMHKLLQDVAGFQIAGEQAYFTDRQGQKLAGLRIELAIEEHICVLKFFHTNLTF